jgi:DNA-binding HxlR family transcriptional regulator
MAPSLCPRFHRAIELIGGRWTGPILQILMAGPARFAQLRDTIPQISDRMLSERLHELEAEGIVVRAVIPASPVRVEYALSEKGRQLQGSLEAVGRWAERWITLPAAATGGTAKPTRSRSASKTKTRPRDRAARSSRA